MTGMILPAPVKYFCQYGSVKLLMTTPLLVLACKNLLCHKYTPACPGFWVSMVKNNRSPSLISPLETGVATAKSSTVDRGTGVPYTFGKMLLIRPLQSMPRVSDPP